MDVAIEVSTVAIKYSILRQAIGGDIIFDTSKPDGIPRKMLDVSRINRLGWQAKVSLDEGIRKTYEWYLSRTENKERSIA